jgi:hypothetical protein
VSAIVAKHNGTWESGASWFRVHFNCKEDSEGWMTEMIEKFPDHRPQRISDLSCRARYKP